MGGQAAGERSTHAPKDASRPTRAVKHESRNAGSNLSSFETALDLLCTIEKRKVKAYRSEYKKLPKGTLYINKVHERTYFECAINGKRERITRNEELIYQLARKRYIKLRIKSYENKLCDNGSKLKLFCYTEEAQIRKMLKRFGDAGLNVMRITCSRQQYEWAHSNFETNNYKQEKLRYITYSGIRVRSKSEQKIGNELELNGVPYRYEQLIRANVDWMDGVIGCGDAYKDYYPDFIVLTATGEIIVWEHLGRVDNEGYRAHNAEKISALRQGLGIRDEMFIMTFEKDLEESGYLQRLIARRILPYI